MNTGTLTAPGGSIIITAVTGESLVNLSQPGHLLSLVIDSTALETITPSNLPDLLMGGEVNHADRVVVLDNGNIQLVSSGVQSPTDAGVAIVSGEINVSNHATAGQLAILGDRVALVDVNINANSNNGGGNVFLGGDFQGLGTLPNASQTFVSRNSFISANALEQGDGGRAIVWADETTQFHGNISATGGSLGGNAGLVEVSGKQHLIFRGNVDTTARHGTGGTLLLDPENITIVDGDGGEHDPQVVDGEIRSEDIIVDANFDVFAGVNIVNIENFTISEKARRLVPIQTLS